MSKGISLYPTKSTGADSPDNVTGTNLAGDKYGMDVAVQGASADGDPATGNPLLVAGVDENGDTQTVSTNTQGKVNVNFNQIPDAGNSQVVTSAEASPGSPWVGDWFQTRTLGINSNLTTLFSATTSGLGGTFTFQYSDDGITPTISETRDIDDFETIRDFPLKNAGEYYRVQFEPDVALGGNSVIINTQHSIFDQAFVRLANQQIEEQNAAMPQTFAYLKSFNPFTRKSLTVRPQSLDPDNSTTATLGADGIYRGTWREWSAVGYVGLSFSCTASHSGNIRVEFSEEESPTDGDDSSVDGQLDDIAYDPVENPDLRRTVAFQGRWVRIKYINDSIAQTIFNLNTTFHSVQTSLVMQQLSEAPGLNNLAGLVRAFLTGFDTDGTPRNVSTTRSGNLSTTNKDAEVGTNQQIDGNGAAKVAEATVLIGDVATLGADLSTDAWNIEENNNATFTVGDGEWILDTGTTANGNVSMQTVGVGRFLGAQFNVYHGGVQLYDNGVADNVRTWGAFNPQDASINGVFFRMNETTPQVGYVKGGVETTIDQSNWNGVGADSWEDPDDLRAYEIRYNAGVIRWFQNGNLLHTATAFTSTYAEDYHFKVAAFNENINGSTTSVEMGIRANLIYRNGKIHGATIAREYGEGTTVIKEGPGYLKCVTFSRTGSLGGTAVHSIYDNTAASGTPIATIRLAGDSAHTVPIESTFSVGLTIAIDTSGTNTASVTWE